MTDHHPPRPLPGTTTGRARAAGRSAAAAPAMQSLAAIARQAMEFAAERPADFAALPDDATFPDPDPTAGPHPAESFLEALGKDPAAARIRGFPHKANPRRIGAIKGEFSTATARKWNADGRGIYVVINNGGDTKAQITTCPALFVEWDDQPINWQLNAWRELDLPEPSLMVDTGGKSIHCYWVLDEPLPREQWEPLQKRLIDHCGSDPNCKDASRVMRLPGYCYARADGSLGPPVTIIHRSEQRYTAAAIEACLPPLLPAPRPGIPLPDGHTPGTLQGELPPRSREELRAAVLRVPPFDHGQGRRRELLALCQRLHVEIGADDALALMTEHSPAVRDMDGYFSGAEPREINRGSLWAWLEEHYDVDIRRHDLKGHRPRPTTTAGSQQPGGGQQPDDATRNAAAEHLAAAATTIDLADVLHPWLAERLTARARSFPLHPLWLLAPALTATSAIVGIRAKVTVKRGWTEPLIFWTGNVVEASTLKTAAAGVFQGPLTRIEIDDRKAHRDAVNAQQEGDPDPPPPIRRLAMDATYEAIAAMAAAPRNHGIASFQDELSGWFANLRRDCSATARAGWLQLWSGQPILIDRKTTEPVFAARCAVSLFGNVQPSKLAQMMATTGDGAESAGDGLWARFLWVRPPHVPFRYVEDDVDISSDIRSLLERLNSTPASTDDDDQPLLIQLDTEARAALAPWWEAWAAEQLCSAPGSAAFLGKLRGYSVRLAGLLALLDVACDALPSRVQLIGMEQLQSHGNGWRMAATADHADRAIRLCLFFLAQFDALQSEIGHGDLPAEVAQLAARARGHGQPVSLRQVMRWKLPHREATSDDALLWLRETVVGTYGIGQVDQGGRQDSWQWRAS